MFAFADMNHQPPEEVSLGNSVGVNIEEATATVEEEEQLQQKQKQEEETECRDPIEEKSLGDGEKDKDNNNNNMDVDSLSPATVFCVKLKQPNSNLLHKMSVPELCRNFRLYKDFDLFFSIEKSLNLVVNSSIFLRIFLTVLLRGVVN